jgi:hypothetical protein
VRPALRQFAEDPIVGPFRLRHTLFIPSR